MSVRFWRIAIGIRCNSPVENEIKTIAFPAISCGAYGYPIPEAAQVAFKTARDFLATDDSIDNITFVLSGEDIYEAYRQLL